MRISLDYANSGDMDAWLKLNIVAIDEIGREKMAKYYGNELNMMQCILRERYSIWRSSGVCTIATTNADSDEIESLYGNIIRGWVKAIFNHVSLTGESRR